MNFQKLVVFLSANDKKKLEILYSPFNKNDTKMILSLSMISNKAMIMLRV